ncbi:type II and III secretion system protein family protein [Pseudoduganella umbonata]|uniref:Pilus assembly protein CpaC n=1 Tax=Pseudoduganella umbonata TaxID=864828 RepID=A0A4P8HSG5_9BURK|nr:type II and III secretion system protein family protein [Pseudoduganella umbonata]MBB3223781.1 pilus assembly protein CpaC [Pseudoduganella umbonata]QCP12797.1 type II and III secretion system protein family protein [Pseudoduganella umbonata]
MKRYAAMLLAGLSAAVHADPAPPIPALPRVTTVTNAPVADPGPRKAAVSARGDGPRCRGQAAAPGQLALQLGKSTLMRLPEPIVSRSVGNPAVLQAMAVASDTLYLVGADVGSTNMIVQVRSGACSVIEVTVAMDVSALQAALAALLPDEKDIRVSAAADTVVLSGTVSDGVTLARVVELAQAYVRRSTKPLGGKDGDAGGASAGSDAQNSASGARIVNMLGVSAPQQVMLEVKIAEVSKTLLDKLEAGTAMRLRGGEWTAALVSNFLTGTLKGGVELSKSPLNALRLDAQRDHGLVRMLAEPTVMAISGQEGSFLAGGKIFIPVAQDNNRVSLEEKEFGVGLRFTPTVLAGGRISLKVAPEVSELSREGIGLTASGLNGAAILPLITTRRANTTVQLFDGQSFAIGGLIRNNQVSNIGALPVLGEVPVLGALFRSTDFQQDRTELLFVITAHLVKPLPPGVALPTDALQPARGGNLFMIGKMEARVPAAAAAPPVQPSAQSPAQPSAFQLK